MAIAEHIGGTPEGFAALMNNKAKEVGAMDSNFVTPHGLDVTGHYTTGRDLAMITRYAMRNKVFEQIVSTKRIQISGRTLSNTNELLGYMQGVDGVKTGYTGLAGKCLVASATKDGRRYIAVALGCVTRDDRSQTCSALLEYAFDNYRTEVIYQEGESLGTIEILKGKTGGVELYADDDRISIPIKEEEKDNIEIRLNYPEKMEAPVSRDVDVGNMNVLVNGEIVSVHRLYTGSAVERKGLWDHFNTLLLKTMDIMS